MSRTFNGSTDYLSAPAVGTALDIATGPMSISFWIYPGALSTEHDIVSKWSGSGAGEQYIISTGVSAFGASGSQIGYCVGQYAAITGVYGFVTTNLTTNQWYQVVLTVDSVGAYTSGSPTVTMKLSGFASGTSFTAFRENRHAGGVNVTIAGQNGSGNYNGRISQLAIWNACLSPEKLSLCKVA